MKVISVYGVASLRRLSSAYVRTRTPSTLASVCALRHVASCPGNAYSSAATATSSSVGDNSPQKRTHYSKLGMDGFTDVKYNTAADTFLEELENVLDDIDHAEVSDLNCSSGVLNLETATHGAYIINKQAPNVQLWLSSPISGPHHYDMVVLTEADGTGAETVQWISDNDGHSLKDLLEKELSQIFGQDVRLP